MNDIYITDNNYMAMFTDVGIFLWIMIHPYLVSTLLALSSLYYYILIKLKKINLQHSSLKNMKQKRESATCKNLDPK